MRMSRFLMGGLGLSLAGIVAVYPLEARAQCSMMGGGGHDHGTSQEASTKKSTSSKKQQKEVDRLLADEQGRQVLADALLEDQSFMTAFIARMLAAPQWRALVSQTLSQPTSAVPDSAAAKPAVLYACPMHPEVTSSKPGSCPKCGMALVQRPRG